MATSKKLKKKEYTDEEDYVYCLMGWLVANADDDLTKKYLDHRNRRCFKFSLDKIRDHLEKTGWYEFSSKYFTEEVGKPKDLHMTKQKDLINHIMAASSKQQAIDETVPHNDIEEATLDTTLSKYADEWCRDNGYPLPKKRKQSVKKA